MVMSKIDFKVPEEILKDISEGSIKLKIFQDELEAININLKEIDTELNLGKISKKTYKEFKSELEKEKRDLEVKIKSIIERNLANLKKLYKIISDSKV